MNTVNLSNSLLKKLNYNPVLQQFILKMNSPLRYLASNYGDSFSAFINPHNPDESEYKISCFSKDNETTTDKVHIFTKKIFKFDCGVCYHQFEMSIFDVEHGEWCPYCDSKKRCSKADCSFCSETSMALIENINEIWSNKNQIKPSEVLMNDKTKNIWIVCVDCKHHYNTTSFLYNNKKKSCPYCNKSKYVVLCAYDKNCHHCYNISFASHPISKYWNYGMNGRLTPYDISKKSSKVCIFHCSDCGYEARISLQKLKQNACSVTCDDCYFPYARKKKEIDYPPLQSTYVPPQPSNMNDNII